MMLHLRFFRRFSARYSCALIVSMTTVSCLAACSSDPLLYTLSPEPGNPVIGGPTPIEVRAPSVTTGLDRDRIVTEDMGYRLHVSSSDAWSEPLAQEISRVLAADLTERLPGKRVFVQNDVTSSQPALYVDLSVRRFATDGSGNAVFEGQYSLVREDDSTSVAAGELKLSMPAGKGTPGMVAALSHLTGQAADQIAAAISRVPVVSTSAVTY